MTIKKGSHERASSKVPPTVGALTVAPSFDRPLLLPVDVPGPVVLAVKFPSSYQRGLKERSFLQINVRENELAYKHGGTIIAGAHTGWESVYSALCSIQHGNGYSVICCKRCFYRYYNYASTILASSSGFGSLVSSNLQSTAKVPGPPSSRFPWRLSCFLKWR